MLYLTRYHPLKQKPKNHELFVPAPSSKVIWARELAQQHERLLAPSNGLHNSLVFIQLSLAVSDPFCCHYTSNRSQACFDTIHFHSQIIIVCNPFL